MSDQYKVTKLSKLLQNVSVGIIGIFLTIFLGVLSVQGTATAVADGIAVKTAKFVTGNFIPVVGRMFTEAADTVISASGLLKKHSRNYRTRHSMFNCRFSSDSNFLHSIYL